MRLSHKKSGNVVFFPTCARLLDQLKFTSLIGFGTIFYVAIIVIVRYFTDRDHDGHLTAAPDVKYMQISVSVFQSISVYALAFGYNYNVPPFYRELSNRSPKRFMMTVLIAFPIILITYIGTGVAGYLNFGSAVANSHAGGNVLNNFPTHDIAVNIARLGLFPALALSFPVIAVTPRRSIHKISVWLWKKIRSTPSEQDALLGGEDDDEPKQMEDAEVDMHLPVYQLAGEAFFLVSTSVLMAAFVPGIGIVIEVIGCLFGVLITLLFPGIVGWKQWSVKAMESGNENNVNPAFHPYRKTLWVMSIVIAIVGVVCCLLGIVSIVKSIAE